MKSLTTLFVLFGVALLLSACGGEDTTTDAMKQGAADATQQVTTAAGGMLETARDQFVSAMKTNVEDIEGKLAGFTDKLSSLSPMAQKAAEEPLKTANDKVTEVKNQLNTLTEAPIEQWTDHKPAVEKAYTELQDSFSKVAGLF